MQIDGKTMETVTDFIFLGSKVTADGDFSHEIKRRLLLERNVMTNRDSILKTRDITFLPRSKHLFISWLQSPSAVTLEPEKKKKKKKSLPMFPLFPHVFAMKLWDRMP